MKRVAKFEKVSFEQFKKDILNTLDFILEEEVQGLYDTITMPVRATKHSAGYDFVSPISFVLSPNNSINIPTGVRCKMEEGWVLKIYPRSGLGFKYRLQLNNTVGIIDGDYYYSDNEGHIFIKVTNCSNENKVVSIDKGNGFAQGIFIEYGITEDDEVNGIRNGGFGSTNKVKE